MKIMLSIDTVYKNITVEDQTLFNITGQDFSWIPSNVKHLMWDGTKGTINYEIDENGNGPVEVITELGIYKKAIQMFNNEKQRLEDEQKLKEETIKEEIEAARDYWKELRRLRIYKLENCDWTQTLDAPLTEEQKTAWRNYRQALRDLPDNITDPKPLVNDDNGNGPEWPTIPS